MPPPDWLRNTSRYLIHANEHTTISVSACNARAANSNEPSNKTSATHLKNRVYVVSHKNNDVYVMMAFSIQKCIVNSEINVTTTNFRKRMGPDCKY